MPDQPTAHQRLTRAGMCAQFADLVLNQHKRELDEQRRRPHRPESEAMTDCPHCPDGHTPATGGSQPWSAWVTEARDGDGQPMQITVARSAGAHVAESDAQWMRDVLNGRTCVMHPEAQR